MVMQADWVRAGAQPSALDTKRHGALGAADASRANLLRQRLLARFGAPGIASYPMKGMRSTEALQAELFFDRSQHE
jgi:hypothetical protein